jgi:hypothetical protein
MAQVNEKFTGKAYKAYGGLLSDAVARPTSVSEPQAEHPDFQVWRSAYGAGLVETPIPNAAAVNNKRWADGRAKKAQAGAQATKASRDRPLSGATVREDERLVYGRWSTPPFS